MHDSSRCYWSREWFYCSLRVVVDCNYMHVREIGGSSATRDRRLSLMHCTSTTPTHKGPSRENVKVSNSYSSDDLATLVICDSDRV
jgi:hypothetical protein